MEFTEEELQELEMYLSSNCHYIPGASPSPGPHAQALPRDAHLHASDEEDYEYDAFENSHNWDPEAIYYDLNGNVIYQPSAQKDLSDVLSESLRLKPPATATATATAGLHEADSVRTGNHTNKVSYESVDKPICRYYPACRFGTNCRFRHPDTSASS